MGIAQVEEVVVGAGVGGMTAALLLARAGAPVSLLERAATPGDVGAWILLQPNGLAVPTGLGLVGELERAGQWMTVSAVRGSGHAPIATLATPDFGHGLDHVFAVQRSLFHEVLLQAVADNPVIDCRLAASVTGVSTDGSRTFTGSDATAPSAPTWSSARTRSISQCVPRGRSVPVSGQPGPVRAGSGPFTDLGFAGPDLARMEWLSAIVWSIAAIGVITLDRPSWHAASRLAAYPYQAIVGSPIERGAA